MEGTYLLAGVFAVGSLGGAYLFAGGPFCCGLSEGTYLLRGSFGAGSLWAPTCLRGCFGARFLGGAYRCGGLLVRGLWGHLPAAGVSDKTRARAGAGARAKAKGTCPESFVAQIPGHRPALALALALLLLLLLSLLHSRGERGGKATRPHALGRLSWKIPGKKGRAEGEACLGWCFSGVLSTRYGWDRGGRMGKAHLLEGITLSFVPALQGRGRVRQENILRGCRRQERWCAKGTLAGLQERGRVRQGPPQKLVTRTPIDRRLRSPIAGMYADDRRRLPYALQRHIRGADRTATIAGRRRMYDDQTIQSAIGRHHGHVPVVTIGATDVFLQWHSVGLQ